MSGIRYGLQIHKDAQADLRALLRDDPNVGGQIVAFLQELEGDQHLLDSLTIEDYEDDKITVRQLVQLQQARWNGYRLTLRDLEPPEDKLPYRILYAFESRARVYHILAIRHRKVVYDDTTIDRACAACSSLGLDPLPRR